MDSKISTERVTKVLDHRGHKELARVLKRCWFERYEWEDYNNGWQTTIRIYGPLKEYEYLRGLARPDYETLLKTVKELHSSDDVDIVGVECKLAMDEDTDERLVTKIEEQKSLMISVATGEKRIQDVNEEYKKRRGEITKMLQAKGIKDPNPFFDLWGWYKRFKSGDLPTYASRRQFMSELYDPLLEQLKRNSVSTPAMFDEPTGWAKVDRTVTEIRQRLEQASNEEQFQTVGTLCREALISLAQAVFDAARHPTVDGVQASPTDFKRMIEAYITTELAGDSMKYSRQHAKAAFDLANELQHKRTATFRHAALCAEATVAVINLVAIVSGQRDP